MKEVNGDLLKLFEQGEFDAIGHQCNCFNTMGAGIARTIAGRFSGAYDADGKTYPGDIRKLGDFSSYLTKHGVIFNIYGQYSMGHGSTNYYALGTAFTKLNSIIKGQKLGLPLIGCGLAGGDWIKVRQIIQETLTDVDVTIVHFKPNK